MAKQFTIPEFYRSSVISLIKAGRRAADNRKRDLAPSIIDMGPVVFKLARHFGFCFGVENAIDIAYRALAENPDARVYLLSEMIHNPQVNENLRSRGVKFILAPDGSQLIPFESLRSDDIVIVPAFGTTVELFAKLEGLGINPRSYDATCPFVEKVWKRASQLGERGFTVIIHGKNTHEETRATFSHARLNAPSLVILDMDEAQSLASYLRGERKLSEFATEFSGRYSEGFNPELDLQRIGVVNQTTMLATETKAISDVLRSAMRERYGEDQAGEHFADTRDTLCYATSENQQSVHALVDAGGDLALVVGGYNSSNTSHLVELCERRYPTFYIKDADEIISRDQIRHLKLRHPQQQLTAIGSKGHPIQGDVVISNNWLPPRAPNSDQPIEILVTAGASCPDALVEQVVLKIAQLFGVQERLSSQLATFNEMLAANSSAVSAHN